MPDAAGKGAGRQGGFTLLELLVVIAIFGLIMAALTGGVRFAGRAWHMQEQRMDRQGDLDAVQNVVRDLVTSGQSFDGDSETLQFVGRLPRALGRDGLFDMELRVSGDRLLLSWQPHIKNPIAPTEGTDNKLAEGIGTLELAYYVKQEDGTGAWVRAFKDKTKPPSLIAFVVQTADGRNWPPLVVAPMIAEAGTK